MCTLEGIHVRGKHGYEGSSSAGDFKVSESDRRHECNNQVGYYPRRSAVATLALMELNRRVHGLHSGWAVRDVDNEYCRRRHVTRLI